MYYHYYDYYYVRMKLKFEKKYYIIYAPFVSSQKHCKMLYLAGRGEIHMET